MDCLSMRASTDCLAGMVLPLSVLVTAFGCNLTIRPSQDGSPVTMPDAGGGAGSSATADAAQGETGGPPVQLQDSSGPVDAQADAGSVPPPPASDAGPDANEAGVATDANDERICTGDVDCPVTNPCLQSYCGSSGKCESTAQPDGTSCFSPDGDEWICLEGVCQQSRCGDGYIDRGQREVCDDGNDDNTDDCVQWCDEARCGDGYVHAGVEQCEPSLDALSCAEDCTFAECGNGVIDTPIETCEPDTSTGPCNDACRFSDTPEWMIEIISADGGFGASRSYPILLLDSAGNPIVVYTETYGVDDSSMPMGKRMISIAHVQKFDADGQSVWSWSSDESFIAFGATVDNQDDIIVTGASVVMQADSAPWLAKFDSAGVQQWSTTLVDPDNYFVGVVTDDETDIVVLSTPDLTGTISLWFASDPVLQAFDSEGNRRPGEMATLAGTRVDGEALSSEFIGGVRRFLMAGATQSEDVSEPYLMLLNADLSQVWDEPVTSGSGESEAGFLRALATEGGDIVALGADRHEDQQLDYWLERFTPEGTRRWTTAQALREDTVFFNTDAFFTHTYVYGYYHFPMAVDGQGNIYMALQYATQFDKLRIAVIDKYTPEGSPEWERPLFFDSGYSVIHPRAQRLVDYPLGLAIDDEGTIYVLSTLLAIAPMPMPGAAGIPSMTRLWLHKWQQPE